MLGRFEHVLHIVGKSHADSLEDLVVEVLRHTESKADANGLYLETDVHMYLASCTNPTELSSRLKVLRQNWRAMTTSVVHDVEVM